MDAIAMARRTHLTRPLLLVSLLIPGSCTAETPGRAEEEPAAEGAQAVDSTHVHAARRIVAFLRGEVDLEQALLAERVELRLAREGGGDRRVVERTRLGSRANWRVNDYPLVPPAWATELTLRPDRHMRCFETDLATVAPGLARLPHVGVKLEPHAAESCLQSWNLTFVFAADAAGPEVVAVVYDQWEW